MPDAPHAHTQLGTQQGRKGPYTQGVEFGADGKPIKRIDFTDHGRPKDHPDNPHEHEIQDTPATPGHTGPQRPLKPTDPEKLRPQE